MYICRKKADAKWSADRRDIAVLKLTLVASNPTTHVRHLDESLAYGIRTNERYNCHPAEI